MYIFSTEYIFLKPKDQTNEHEQKNKWTIKLKMYIYTANIDLYLFFICFNNIYKHHKHLKIKKKNQKNDKMIKKTILFKK